MSRSRVETVRVLRARYELVAGACGEKDVRGLREVNVREPEVGLDLRQSRVPIPRAWRL